MTFSYFTKPPRGWIYWQEKGAGKSLAISPLPKNNHVILIDDEINTGLTYIDAIEALRKKYIHVDQILVVAEIIREQMGRKIIKNKFKDVKIDSLYQIPEPKYDYKFNNYIFEI